MAESSAELMVDNLCGQFNLSAVPVYNLINLGRYVVTDFALTFNFCCELGLIASERSCTRCRRKLKLSLDHREEKSTPVIFRCTNSKCAMHSYYFSLRDGTLFESSKLSIEKVVILANLFVSKITSFQQIQDQCQLSGETKLSSETISDWLSYFREICLEVVAQKTSKLIGGPGLTVEVDESKFGKRKYNKGRLVEGQWVVGGICRETKEVFLAPCPQKQRDAATLLTIINNHVNKQSTIITDCWRAYDQLNADSWAHLTVNHQYNFVGMCVT